MSMQTIRDAFAAAAGGALRLHNAGMSYSGTAQVLKFTGWRDNGLPFVFVSDPFTGDPVVRAAEIARDLIAAHTGQPSERPMPAPTPITGLAGVLRDQLKAATDRAGQIAARATSSVTNLHGVLDTAEGVVKDVDSAAADIQSALGLSTNGGPALDPLEK